MPLISVVFGFLIIAHIDIFLIMLPFMIKISQTVSIYALRVNKLGLVMLNSSLVLFLLSLVHLLIFFVGGDRRD